MYSCHFGNVKTVRRSCAASTASTLYCRLTNLTFICEDKNCMFGFGYNVFGQICGLREQKCENNDSEEVSLAGRPDVLDVAVQLDPRFTEEVVKVQASWSNTFFLKRDGRVATFGWIPELKALGKINDFFPDEIVQDISCSCNKVAFLSKLGKLYLWSDFMLSNSSPAAVDLKESLSLIRCGDLLTIVLTADGHLGELVTEGSKVSDEKPKIFFAEIPFSHCVRTVGCGKEHVLILTDKGEVFSFGGGSRGQLGNGRLEQQDEPKIIDALAGIKITVISCGGWHSAVVSSWGDLYMWGWNKDGQVGVLDDSTDAVQIQAIPVPVLFSNDRVTDVSCGTRHTAAITCNGELWTWGFGFYGQLGQGSRMSCHKPTQVKLPPTLPTLKAVEMSVFCSNWNTFGSVKQERSK